MNDNSWVYTDIVKDHFVNPRNIWKDGDGFEPDGVGIVGAVSCGDEMQIGIKVKDDIITELRWKTYGCASAIASTSMVSEIAVGMTLEEAYRITPQTITDKLGTLPNHKIHCSVLGDDGLRKAIDNYLFRQGRENPFNDKALRIICKCRNVTNRDLRALHTDMGIDDLESVQRFTEYGTCCGHCREEMKKEWDKVLSEDL